MNPELIQSIQHIFNKDKVLQKIGSQSAEYYISKEYLQQCSLISASEHKYLYNIAANVTCSEIKGLQDFIKQLGFQTAEERISGCFFTQKTASWDGIPIICVMIGGSIL